MEKAAADLLPERGNLPCFIHAGTSPRRRSLLRFLHARLSNAGPSRLALSGLVDVIAAASGADGGGCV